MESRFSQTVLASILENLNPDFLKISESLKLILSVCLFTAMCLFVYRYENIDVSLKFPNTFVKGVLS